MSLKYVASYLLSVTCGNESPSKSDVKAVLSSVGSEVDEQALDAFFAAMSGKSVHETITAGLEKLQKVPAGGVALAAGAGPAAASAAAPEAAAAPEPEEEEDDMGFSLFD